MRPHDQRTKLIALPVKADGNCLLYAFTVAWCHLIRTNQYQLEEKPFQILNDAIKRNSQNDALLFSHAQELTNYIQSSTYENITQLQKKMVRALRDLAATQGGQSNQYQADKEYLMLIHAENLCNLFHLNIEGYQWDNSEGFHEVEPGEYSSNWSLDKSKPSIKIGYKSDHWNPIFALDEVNFSWLIPAYCEYRGIDRDDITIIDGLIAEKLQKIYDQEGEALSENHSSSSREKENQLFDKAIRGVFQDNKDMITGRLKQHGLFGSALPPREALQPHCSSEDTLRPNTNTLTTPLITVP